MVKFSFLLNSAGLQPSRRGRGRGNRSRGKLNMRKDGTVKFEEDFDFETANAQFHKDEIDKELQNKLKLKGTTWFSFPPSDTTIFSVYQVNSRMLLQL